ncbi:MAG TPA: hypothetical protein VKZ63_01030 [Kofleriaceae bacterium]|nr:hypothetical protein [Kofleriaceae bacterium]
MDPCVGEMMCPPPSIGWSALILWTITLYGVLGILSIFTACVQWRDPSQTGSRIARVLALLDLGGAAAAPILLMVVLGAPRAAIGVIAAQLALAALCHGAARRRAEAELPRARLVR